MLLLAYALANIQDYGILYISHQYTHTYTHILYTEVLSGTIDFKRLQKKDNFRTPKSLF